MANLRKSLSPFLELTKPRIVTMVLVSTALGFSLAQGGVHDFALLIWTLVGTAAVAGGSAALNHYFEREVDATMMRTRDRPLPTGRIRPSTAMSFGLCLILIGLGVLVVQVNLLTAFLALLTAFLYVVIYTPLKRVTWLNTSLGSIPGALPPVGGWAAASAELDAGAWALFAILFAWQHPHFYAIAWIFRQDYQRGGMKMLPTLETDGRRTCRHILGFSVLLLAVSLLPTVLGISGQLYLAGAIALGLGLLAAGIALRLSPSDLAARRLLKASILYLPLLFLLSIVDIGI
jgi:protoheme IX farnesyltransferase